MSDKKKAYLENGVLIESGNIRYWLREQARYLKATNEYSTSEKKLFEFENQEFLMRNARIGHPSTYQDKEPTATFYVVDIHGQLFNSNKARYEGYTVLETGTYRRDSVLDRLIKLF
jgi:hypothetical protein